MGKTAKLLLLIFLIFSCDFNDKVTIFLIGDSTMSNKPNPEENPERGWGQMLHIFFNENVSIRNYAVNGRSTKSFIDEGRWESVLSEIEKGDYIFIQFGHNDQKNKDSLRFTNAHTGYRKNLTKFVNETRDKGCNPVLFSSVVRRKFNKFGVLIDTHGIYPLIMRQIAIELKVPFVDLQLKSENLVLSLGQEKSKEIYLWVEPGKIVMYPEGKQDNTHFSIKGATTIAKLAIEDLKENFVVPAKYFRN